VCVNRHSSVFDEKPIDPQVRYEGSSKSFAAATNARWISKPFVDVGLALIAISPPLAYRRQLPMSIAIATVSVKAFDNCGTQDVPKFSCVRRLLKNKLLTALIEQNVERRRIRPCRARICFGSIKRPWNIHRVDSGKLSLEHVDKIGCR